MVLTGYHNNTCDYCGRKNTYIKKTNANVVDDAIRFVSQKTKDNAESKDSSNEDDKESNEFDYGEEEDQIEEVQGEEAVEITTNEVFLENNKILYKDHLFSGRARRGRVRRGYNNRNACKSRMGFKPCVKICQNIRFNWSHSSRPLR
jgi:hypothetical protein